MRDSSNPKESIEQRFVYSAPPTLDAGSDLIIRGSINCPWPMEEYAKGWLWRDPQSGGVTSLGKVTVFDADGSLLPATMRVSKNHTEIRVPREALLAANYPVTVDPEIGVDDFLVSVKEDGENSQGHYLPISSVSKLDPAVAYRPADNTYLVVWSGIESEYKREIFGQFINASTGALVGENFVLTSHGIADKTNLGAINPDLAYDSNADRFMLVWERVLNGSREAWSQLLTGNGAFLGGSLKLSNEDGGSSPAVAYNPAAGAPGEGGRFGVIWISQSQYDSGQIQLLSAGGAPIGEILRTAPAHEARIAAGPDGSFMAIFATQMVNTPPFDRQLSSQLVSPEGNLTRNTPRRITHGTYDARGLDIAYVPALGAYVVVWAGRFSWDPFADDLEWKLAGQIVDLYGHRQFSHDIVLSKPNSPDLKENSNPRLVVDPVSGEVTLAYLGQVLDNSGMPTPETEVFAAPLDFQNDIEVGPRSRLTRTGAGGDGNYPVRHLNLAINPTSGSIFSTWISLDTQHDSIYANQIYEVRGQQFERSAAGLFSPSSPKRRISTRENEWINFEPEKSAAWADVAYNSDHDQYLVVWQEREENDSLDHTIYSLHGQHLNGDGQTIHGGNFDFWSSTATLPNASSARVVWDSVGSNYIVAF